MSFLKDQVFPEPVFEEAVEPKTKADHGKDGGRPRQIG
jgi:translation elongation factor EF-G